MTIEELALSEDGLGIEPQTDAGPRSAWSAGMRSIEGRIGIGLCLLILAVALVGPLVAPGSPTAVGVGAPDSGPSSSHLLGTDELGRDVLSRVLHGGASVLIVPLLSVAAALALAGTIGILAAYRGGRVDTVLMRSCDIFMSFPPLLLVLVLITGIGQSRPAVGASVALVFFPGMTRVVRAAAQSVVTHDYIAAAKARGERLWTIFGAEILPNIAAPVIADFALRLTYAVIFVSTLNFLGLGAQPPNPDWGLMVAENQLILTANPLAVLAPAACIAALSIGSNLIADALTRQLTKDTASGAVRL